MSFSAFAALSLICLDAQALAPTLAPAAVAMDSAPVAAPVPAAAANASAEAETLAPPAAETLEQVGVKIAPREFAEDPVEGPIEGPLAFEGESDAAIVERLRDYLESVGTLQGDFTQVSPSGAVSTGRFYLRRPGFFRFEYDPPTPLLIVANGGMVYVRDDALETTDSYPVGTTPLKFLLRKRVELDDDAKAIAVDRGVDTVAVTFASEDEQTEGELTIIVNAPQMTLARWIVRDLQQGITVVSLDNVQQGVRLANRLFETPEAGGRFLKN
jgi:outer membrane lipoprotein-sorting protein